MKKFLCVICSVLILLSCSSCDISRGKTFDQAKIAVAVDSNELLAAKKYCIANDAEIIEYSSIYDAVIAVENGKADLVVLDEYLVSNIIDADSRLELYENEIFSLSYCAYFEKDNKKLCDEFNEAFKILKDTGEIDRIVEAHKKGGVVSPPESSGEKGELIMLCDPIFETLLYYDSVGEIAGVDLDIAKAVCAELGYNLVLKPVDFEEMFLALDTGEGDFILSATEYTEERAEYYRASDVYNTLTYSLYKRK